MNRILQLILDKNDKEMIQKKLRKGYSTVPLFTALDELKGKSLFEHLKKYNKVKTWTLEDFVKAGAVDLDEENEKGQTLLQIFIINDELANITMLLQKGKLVLKKKDYKLADPEVIEGARDFFDYRPGENEVSIFEFCSNPKRKKHYSRDLKALLRDQADTTDGESSEAEDIESLELTSAEEKSLSRLRDRKLTAFNKNQEDDGTLCLVAGRGMHFSPKYFKPKTVKKVIETKNQQRAAISQSTLFDAGYAADDEVDENDRQIQARNKHNLKFIKDLKGSKDRKEKKIGSSAPAATRNNIKFDSHYYRYMQVYINSYSRLFNIGAIKVDFGFDTKNNPELSASWNFEKAAYYGSGFRLNWNESKLRKDPHYRRFTGKAKHPNVGYLDVYAFDIDYVRTHGFDRQIMCKEGKIRLSAFYRHEAEIIFHSMIPARFHLGRFILSMPDHEMKDAPANKKSEEYKDRINDITERAARQQAATIQETIHCRLFRTEKPQVMVHDHGNKLSSTIFTL
jgi:hypothetical protein